MFKAIGFLSIFSVFLLVTNSYAQHDFNCNVSFNGTNSYIAIPHDPELNTPTGITIEAWINVPSYPASVSSIVGKNPATSWFLGMTSTGNLGFQVVNNFVLSTATVPLNTWTHVAATYDGVNLTTIYINGVAAGSGNNITGPIPTNTDSLYIGCERTGVTPTYFFTGMIDNIRIWNYSRSSAQIAANRFGLFQFNPGTGNYAGLIATYTLDNDYSDWSGNTFNGGFGRNLSAANCSFTKPTNYEDYSNSVYLDATSWVSSTPWPDYNATTGLTIEAWIRKDTTLAQNSFQNLINCSNPSGYSYALYLANNGANLALSVNFDAVVATETGAAIGGRWTYVAATYNGATGQIKLYVNGDSVGSGTGSPQNIASLATDSLFMGYNSASCCTGNKFNGQMQEIRISKNFVKTSAAIKQDMYVFRGQGGATQNDIVIDFNKTTSFARLTNNAIASLVKFRGNAKLVSPHSQLDAFPSPPILFDISYLPNTNYLFSTKRFYIPDNNATGVTDSIFVPQGGNLADLKVCVMMNHTYASDIRLALTNPVGTTVSLTPTSGTQGGNDMICVFDMTADSTMIYNTANIAPPYTPRIKPANSLAAFNGQNAAGWWKLKFSDAAAGDIGYVSGWGINPTYVTGIHNNNQNPYTFKLAQNYPNPFNPVTSIKYEIARDDKVTIKVFDITGKLVGTLVNELKKAGSYEVTFDATNLASGVYIYKIESGNFVDTKKMILIK